MDDQRTPARSVTTADLVFYIQAALLGLAVLVCLDLAGSVAVPMAGALLLGIALSPVQRRLGRGRFLSWVVAFGLAFLLFVLALGILVLVAAPALSLIDQMPRIGEMLKTELDQLRAPLERLREQTSDLEALADGTGEAEARDGSAETVQMEEPSLLSRLVTNLRAFGSRFFVMLGLLFFLLLTRKTDRPTPAVPATGDWAGAWALFTRACERKLYQYVTVYSAINLALGATIGLSLWIYGVEDAVFWGLLASVLNFFPYVGLFVGVALLLIDSLAAFGAFWPAVWPALIYLGINLFEAQFVTPAILGRNLTLNPALIFSSVIVWGWLWGIAGALMAVPILLVMATAWSSFAPLIRGRR